MVSVIIPVFNGARYIRESIDSVFRSTLTDIEVVVVDDASTDSTRSILSEYGDAIVVATQPERAGVWSARNRGVSISRGDVIAFHDADDIMSPQRCDVQRTHLLSHPALSLVFGWMEEFYRTSDEERTVRHVAGVCPGTLMVRRALMQNVGPFRTEWELASFGEWLHRVKAAGYEADTLSSVVTRRRLHSGSSGAGKGKQLAREWLAMLRDRRGVDG